jgi:SAM-dependent methyltransferase
MVFWNKEIMNFNEIFSGVQMPIHHRYSLLINSLQFHSPVMKTDLWNEQNTSWPIQADIFVEVDPLMVQKAREKGMKAINCSITDLKLENDSVSTIIDLSTIDHIEDPYPALKEYYRVLRKEKKSNCYIVCWLGKKEAAVKMTNWNGWQYCFREIDFIKKVSKAGFKIKFKEMFEGLGDDQYYLKFFHLKLQNNRFITPNYWASLFSFIKLLMQLTNLIPLNRRWNIKRFVKLNNKVIVSGSLFNWNIVNIKPCKDGIHLTALDTDPHFILPKTTLPTGNMILKIEITPPGMTTLQLFYITDEKDDYNENQSVSKPLKDCRQTVFIPVPGVSVQGKLRIDPGNSMGEYIIHKIEIYEFYY